MKTMIHILLATLLLITFSCNNKQVSKEKEQTPVENQTSENDNWPIRQSIDLFTLQPRDSTHTAFISLSDIYPLSGEDSDTLALPNIKEKGIDAAQYFILEGKYRERFLSKTKIAETDSVFIYDYSKNKLVSFIVKNLKVAAMINIYASADDWPYPPYYYMIGFEIDKRKVKGFSDYYTDVLVYVGTKNPFTQEQLTAIVWKKITTKDYPSKTVNDEDKSYLQNSTLGNTYLYQTDSLQYFLQDHLNRDNYVYARRLLVVKSKTKDIIIEKIFGRGEGNSPSPLNYQDEYGTINQWTGKLFKNKPPVVFGFEYVSFGCSGISIIDKSNEDIYINCDNRH